MEECIFSIKFFSLYVQLTKTMRLQILYKDREAQYRTKILLKIK
jgi:hypothetical protein